MEENNAHPLMNDPVEDFLNMAVLHQMVPHMAVPYQYVGAVEQLVGKPLIGVVQGLDRHFKVRILLL